MPDFLLGHQQVRTLVVHESPAAEQFALQSCLQRRLARGDGTDEIADADLAVGEDVGA